MPAFVARCSFGAYIESAFFLGLSAPQSQHVVTNTTIVNTPK
jgi:hypothetical protein